MKPPRKDHLINRALEDQRKRRDVEAALAATEAGEPHGHDSSETAADERRSRQPEVAGSSPARGLASSPAASIILPTEHPDGCDCTRCEDARRVAIGLHPKDEDVYPWEPRKRRRSLFAEVRRAK